MLTVPERVVWAVEVVSPGPAERLVEIGCGPGVAAGLVCSRLSSGHLLAVDRSAVAVERTARRNAAHIAAGRLSVRQSSLGSLEVPESSVDKAFSVNVNVFWTGSAERELAVLRGVLRPGGLLAVLYGHGPGSADRVLATVSGALRAGGFADVTVVEADRGVGVVGFAP